MNETPDNEEEIKSEKFEDHKKYYEDRTFKSLEMSKPEHSLIMFLMQLTSYLQQSIGTVPAIDMKQYLSNIGEKIDKEI